MTTTALDRRTSLSIFERMAASDNGARLVSCTCAGESAEVVVAVGRARGYSRATVDLSPAPRRAP